MATLEEALQGRYGNRKRFTADARARIARNPRITTSELARRLGMDRANLSAILSDRRGASIMVLIRIDNALTALEQEVGDGE